MADWNSNLKKLREAAKLTQKELSDASGVSQELISQLETGKRPFTQKTLDSLLPCIGAAYSDIFGRNLPDNVLGLEHADIITKFKQPELAKEINADMVDLESLDPSELEGVADYVKTRLKRLKAKEEPSFSKKNTA